MISPDSKKVLIVDDSSFQRKLIKFTLQGEGFEILGEAETGYDAVQKFKQLHPPLVIIDIVLPRMDGITAVQEMKKIDSNVKVIMISSYSSKEKVMQAIMAGAKQYLLKPFEPEKLIEVTNKVLKDS
ncbi:MAG: response regulator [Calditrichaeota bacterium]|nr:response regulator [Calditrichota bacterium]